MSYKKASQMARSRLIDIMLLKQNSMFNVARD